MVGNCSELAPTKMPETFSIPSVLLRENKQVLQTIEPMTNNKRWIIFYIAEDLDEAPEIPFGLMGGSTVRSTLHEEYDSRGKTPDDIQPGRRLVEHITLANKRTVVMPTPWVVSSVTCCPAFDDSELAGTIVARCKLDPLCVEEWEQALYEI